MSHRADMICILKFLKGYNPVKTSGGVMIFVGGGRVVR